MYKFIRPILFYRDAEQTHNAFTKAGELLHFSAASRLVSSLYGFYDSSLETTVFGLQFANPVGLAAGFDKGARLLHILPSFGFGHIEIGAVTPKPQPGNPKPRLFHVPEKQALINRMGFNNEGVEIIVKRLQKTKASCVVGANIGKNKDTSNEDAVKDYITCFTALQNIVDYIVVNVSSPNTPGLRDLQDKDMLAVILQRLHDQNSGNIPILLKIAPELEGSQIHDIVSVAQETRVAGIIATNTLRVAQGGLSGKPLRECSTQVVRELYRESNGKIPIIGVGGIFSGEDAYEKITAGASLVQLYTSFIYEGPGIAKKINKELVRLLKADGFSNISQAVGTKA